MDTASKNKLKELLHHLSDIDYVHPEDIPNIDLYMDQVLTFLDHNLEKDATEDDDKPMTKTMINNYTKNQILPPPEKKKYSRDHMLDLIFIYYMKNFLSMKDIKSILDPINEKYFNTDSELNIYDIYNKVVDIESGVAKDLLKDVIRKFSSSREVFSDQTPDDQTTLQDFSFICMLSFDVFIKKMLIEEYIKSINE